MHFTCTFVDDAEDVDIIIPMYNLTESSDNYFMTAASLQNYYRDKMHDDANENNDNYYRLDGEKKRTIISFE